MKKSIRIKAAAIALCLGVQLSYSSPAMAYSWLETIHEAAQDASIITIGNKIDTEKNRAIGAETVLQGNIDTEKNRAIGAETVLQGNIDTEKNRAIGAETVLQGNIDTEKNRALLAESGLKKDIKEEAFKRWMADQHEAYERWMADRYEAYKRMEADIWLNGKIDNETSERIARDNYLDNRITTETLRLDGRIDNLSTRVDKVGALAAANAGLAPLAYDPEARTQFAIGGGTYAGSNAVAIGVYHYPNKDVLLNAGWAFCAGENMGHAGIAWKIGGPKVKSAAAPDKAVTTMVAVTATDDDSIINRTNRILSSAE